jgi:hypothetical protein
VVIIDIVAGLSALRVFPALLTARLTLADLLAATRFSWTTALLFLPFGACLDLVLLAGTPVVVAVRHERLSFSVMTRLQLKRAA